MSYNATGNGKRESQKIMAIGQSASKHLIVNCDMMKVQRLGESRRAKRPEMRGQNACEASGKRQVLSEGKSNAFWLPRMDRLPNARWLWSVSLERENGLRAPRSVRTVQRRNEIDVCPTYVRQQKVRELRSLMAGDFQREYGGYGGEIQAGTWSKKWSCKIVYGPSKGHPLGNRDAQGNCQTLWRDATTCIHDSIRSNMAQHLKDIVCSNEKSLAAKAGAIVANSIEHKDDDSFAKRGAKIGDSLKIRMPNQYTIRTGASLSTQDVTESSETLQVATQKGVDVTFTSAELTLSLDDFASRILEPAMSVLAANIEADAYSMYKDVYNMVDGDGAAIAFSHIMQGRKTLNDNLAPIDNNRTALLGTTHAYKVVDALKGLFQDSSQISKQYKEGMMGRTGGFDFLESTFAGKHTTGTSAQGDTSYDCNTSTGITSGTATITVSTGTTTLLKGDVITIADVYRVHPETKVSTGELQQFVLTADSGASATSLAVSPTPVTSGAKQNVTLVSAGASKTVSKIGAGNAGTLDTSMVYHKDAFVFATADLENVAQYGAWGAREVFDGISIRIARQYAIATDTVPCRIDVLYGYKTIRPQLACRIHADG